MKLDDGTLYLVTMTYDLFVVLHVEKIAVGVFDSERRADLSKHHFLRMKLDLRGGFATAISLAYVGASVGDVGAQHISRDVEYHGDVGNFEVD